MKDFDPAKYGEAVARILALDGNGQRLMPLTAGGCSHAEAKKVLKLASPQDLFPRAPDPLAPMAGLWLYFSCFDEGHSLIDDPHSKEAVWWHAIAHRQEPDSANAAYWFRTLGSHSLFPRLARETSRILQAMPSVTLAEEWDPLAFIRFCEDARLHPGSAQEQAALEIQRAEWQILFDYSGSAP